MTAVRTARDTTRARVVDAAARLLAEGGAAAVTTRAVADAAGVQAPTLYRLFGDKDGLLDAVAEQVTATFAAAKASVARRASDTDLDPLADLVAGWDAYVDFGLAHPTLFALLADPERARRSPATRAGLAVLADRVHRLAAAGRLRVPEPRAVELIHAAGLGAVLTLLAQDAPDRTLADDLRDAVLARVVADEPATTPPDRSAAVALRAQVQSLDGLTDGERTLLAEWLDRLARG